MVESRSLQSGKCLLHYQLIISDFVVSGFLTDSLQHLELLTD